MNIDPSKTEEKQFNHKAVTGEKFNLKNFKRRCDCGYTLSNRHVKRQFAYPVDYNESSGNTHINVKTFLVCPMCERGIMHHSGFVIAGFPADIFAYLNFRRNP